ncbi:MAG: hypothetical protein QF599_10170 [Planctomycetota bacterium]|nr:hypothetical protein [Planctomycetota bacterium]
MNPAGARSGSLDRLVGAGLVLALVGVAIFVAGAKPVKDNASARNSHERGRRGALRLFQELGFDARIFDAAPGALPAGRSLLWLPRSPSFAGTGRPPESDGEQYSELDGEADDANPRGRSVLGHLHQAERYRDFMAGGGSLVISQGNDTARFLSQALGLMPPPALVAPPSGSTLRVSLPSGEVLSVEDGLLEGDLVEDELVEEGLGESGSTESPPRSSTPWQKWLTAEDGTPLILRHGESAAGSVFLLWDGAWLANDAIGRADHGLLAVRLAEAAVGAPAATILFDEYALGGWRPQGKAALALAPAARAATLTLLLLALIFIWRLAWPREFPRDQPQRDTLFPLARARSQAALLERAGRGDLLARMLVAGRLGESGGGQDQPKAIRNHLESDGGQNPSNAIRNNLESGGGQNPSKAIRDILEADGSPDLVSLNAELDRQ